MRISVVIPAWNAAATLAETLDCVAAQSRPADEVIVVDDGSTDASAEIAVSHPLRLRLLRKAHSGAPATMNLGVASATGDCLAFLDADDLWPADKLQRQADILAARPDLDGVLGHFESFVCPSVPAVEAGRFVVPSAPQPGWLTGTLLVRTEAFARVGHFAEDLSNGFAIDWFDRARAAGLGFAMLDAVLLRRRLHPGSLAARNRGSDAAMLEMARRAIARRRQGA
ncbi:MAG: glycosyltransferase family A protein [Gallionellaceae bacterium]|nr:glycosyltransferase family A protein [Gallionellaceae bacterium]